MDEIKRGNFREDLFYRINVMPLHIPPLRDRGNDILELADLISLLKKIEKEAQHPYLLWKIQ